MPSLQETNKEKGHTLLKFTKGKSTSDFDQTYSLCGNLIKNTLGVT